MSANYEISVLMSIYNEPLSYIKQSVNSVLHQTFPIKELIIVVDNLSLENNIIDYLRGLPACVHVIYNDENIGLAMCMNKAFQFSTGNIIARMDSDDIAMETRFEVEVKALHEHNCDLVCSNYKLIDENSHELNNNYLSYTNDNLTAKLPYSNTIHHPTVIMTREAFVKVGGYRNFPCSQDYDLWLRMYDLNMTFYIVPDQLLLYRIRTTSTTQKNGMKQSLTIRYIRKLYRERKKYGNDSFSSENYEEYLTENGLYNNHVIEKYLENSKFKKYIDSMRGENNTLRRGIYKLILFCKSPFHRNIYINNMKEVILEKFKK